VAVKGVMDDVEYLNHLIEDVAKTDKAALITACAGASVVYLVFDLLNKTTFETLTTTILPWFKDGELKANNVILIGTNTEQRGKLMLE
jgi:hypothetical protein